MSAIIEIDLKTGKVGSSQAAETPLFMEYRRPDILNEYVIMQRRAARQGTQSTLTRSEVAGTGKKPFKQKGTGNARQGSLKGPHQYGGGVCFAPKPRSYSSSLNKSLRRKALAVAISQRAYEQKLFSAADFVVASGKTKDAANVLSKLAVKSVLLVGNFSPETWRACKNLTTLKLLEPQNLNVKDVMAFEACVLTSEALAWLKQNLEPKLGQDREQAA